MKYMGLQIDKSKLMKKDEVIGYLGEGRVSYTEFSDHRTHYEQEFGQDLVWNYQDCGGSFPGFFLMPVQEGILSLPYDSVENDDSEIIVVDNARLLSADDLQFLLKEYRSYAEGLMNAMEEMIADSREEES